MENKIVSKFQSAIVQRICCSLCFPKNALKCKENVVCAGEGETPNGEHGEHCGGVVWHGEG